MVMSFQEVTGPLVSRAIQRNEEDYVHLPFSIEDDRNIEQMLQEIKSFTWRPWKILAQKQSLEALGNKIAHLHSFRFLEACIATPYRIECIQAIVKRKILGAAFIDSFAKRLADHHRINNLTKYWPAILDIIKQKTGMGSEHFLAWTRDGNQDWKAFLHRVFFKK